MEMENLKEIQLMINDARRLHGHLGPFLVIGVKMGMAAKKALGVSNEECIFLRAEANVPIFPPYSCLLDGIQVSTTCTVGNQRLTIKNSGEICVRFSKHGVAKTVKITLKPKLALELKKKHVEQTLTEKFANELASMPINKLFQVDLE
jgi:formylmethanofuran dehydrogenase subunit E